MTETASKINSKEYTVIFVASFFGGLLNGLLGAAGGILLGLVLSRLFRGEDKPLSDRRDIYANVQIAMICVSAVSLSIYSSRGDVSFSESGWLVLPAALGGIAGSLILRKISSGAVGKIFAILVIWSGIRMLWG